MSGLPPLTLESIDRVLRQLGCGPTPESAAYTCVKCRTEHLTITSNGAGPIVTCADCGDLGAYLETVADGLPNGRGAKGAHVDVLEVLRDDLGIPELERVDKHGRMGSNYTLHLTDGRRIEIGSVATLLSQAKFRAAVLPQLRRSPKRQKQAKWDEIIDRIEAFAEERDTVATVEDETRGWLAGYLAHAAVISAVDTGDSATVHDLIGGSRGGLPPFFDREGRLHVRLEPVVQWLGRMAGVRVTAPELSMRLARMDFTRVRLTGGKGEDTRRARVWVSPADFERGLR